MCLLLVGLLFFKLFCTIWPRTAIQFHCTQLVHHSDNKGSINVWERMAFRKFISDPVLISQTNVYVCERWESEGQSWFTHTYTTIKDKLPAPAQSSICGLLITQHTSLFTTGSQSDKPTAVLSAPTSTHTHAVILTAICCTDQKVSDTSGVSESHRTEFWGASGAVVWLLDT